MNDFVVEQYDKLYRSISFERREILKYICCRYDCSTVLYPGCAIHITPSFYFPHVVYVDKSESSKKFFSHGREVEDLVLSQKKYKRRPFIHYLHADFSKALPLRDKSFDLLISIFSGKQVEYCESYLAAGGIVLTNNLFSDESFLSLSSHFRLRETLVIRRGKIISFKEQRLKARQSTLKSSGQGFRYEDNEIYYIYEITSQRNNPQDEICSIRQSV